MTRTAANVALAIVLVAWGCGTSGPAADLTASGDEEGVQGEADVSGPEATDTPDGEAANDPADLAPDPIAPDPAGPETAETVPETADVAEPDDVAGIEPGPEPAPEAAETVDPGTTGEPALDAGADPAEDAAADTPTDPVDDPADEPETGPTGFPWPWCPTASAYVGDDWAWTVPVASTALYCGMFNETRTLEQELAAKVQLQFIQGTYAVPSATGTVPLTLPLCARFLTAGAQPVLAGVGAAQVSVNPGSISITLTQPMLANGGDAWQLQGYIYSPTTTAGPTATIDGAYDGGGAPVSSVMLCKGDCTTYVDQRRISSCAFEGTTLNRHTLVFDGGSAILDVRIGVTMAGTEPGIFWHAEGVLDGVAFTVDDYWRLVYNPAHHHFTRNFAVLFDSPIGAACGLRVDGFDPYTLAATVSTVACDLTKLQARALLSAELVKL